VSTFSQ